MFVCLFWVEQMVGQEDDFEELQPASSTLKI